MNCELARYCSFECTVAVAHYKGNCKVMRVSTTWIEPKKMAESMNMLILFEEVDKQTMINYNTMWLIELFIPFRVPRQMGHTSRLTMQSGKLFFMQNK